MRLNLASLCPIGRIPEADYSILVADGQSFAFWGKGKTGKPSLYLKLELVDRLIRLRLPNRDVLATRGERLSVGRERDIVITAARSFEFMNLFSRTQIPEP